MSTQDFEKPVTSSFVLTVLMVCRVAFCCALYPCPFAFGRGAFCLALTHIWTSVGRIGNSTGREIDLYNHKLVEITTGRDANCDLYR